MAKDPAFLFYPNDWIGGTMYFTFEQKGAYFELLMLQFNNNGKFTEAQAKQVLSICPSIWDSIKDKFKTDGTHFWNERLQLEIEKRKNFTESRRKNAKSIKTESAYAKHMPQHMENVNVNEDDFNKGHDYFKTKFLSDECKQDVIDIEALLGKKINKTIVSEFNLYIKTEGKTHYHYSEWKTHFRNWYKKKAPEQPTSGKKYIKLD